MLIRSIGSICTATFRRMGKPSDGPLIFAGMSCHPAMGQVKLR
jgi:hypothetical protein